MESTTPARKKERSPRRVAITAFLITVAIGVGATAAIVLVGPVGPAVADAYKVITNGTCPAAIVVALLAYFLARGRQKNQ